MARTLLALDIAGDVGWCFGPVTSRALKVGTWVLPRIGGEGARFASFENELAAAMEVFQPDDLAVEAPLPLPAQNSMNVAKQQLGLRAIALSEAYRASAAVHEVDAYTVRKEVLGTGRFAKGKVKEVVYRWAISQGLDVPDHNAADASVLHRYYASRLTG